MATRTISKTLFSAPIWRQNNDSTWDGIDSNYIDAFIDEGCYLCALTMLTACMEGSTTLKPIALVNRGVTSQNHPRITSYNVSNQFTLAEDKTVSNNNNYYIQKIAKAIIEDDVPVFIQVPGHAVVACGFRGTVTTNVNGFPVYSTVLSSHIRFYDPYQGRYDHNLEGLIAKYGNIEKIRYPV